MPKLSMYRPEKGNDFKFIERMPSLRHLNSNIKDNTIKEIDLSPLSNLKSIGDFFLFNCSALTSIDLRPLSNIKSIENSFLLSCHGLTSIDLSHLSNL